MKKASKKKQLSFSIAKSKKPAATVKQGQNLAAFVSGKDVKRLSLDLPVEMHTRLKLHCTARGQKMVDFLITLIENSLRESKS